jgi:hypothetical protein
VHVGVLGIYAGVPIFIRCWFLGLIQVSLLRTYSLLGEPHDNLIISFIKTIIFAGVGVRMLYSSELKIFEGILIKDLIDVS